MTRFAICDTDIDLVGEIADSIRKQYAPCTTQYMYGPDALEAFLDANPGSVDILITEIDLRGKNSIDIISRYYTSTLPLQIIYLTKNINYCTDVYRTRHVDFLIKPVTMPMLDQAITRALEALGLSKRKGVCILCNGNTYLLDFSSLVYAESHNRIIRVVSLHRSFEMYGKLADFCARLDTRFLQCHKSYVVNLDFVSQFCRDHFVLNSGDVIPISQSRRKVVGTLFWRHVCDSYAQIDGSQ